ncbi:MAG: GBS Bsp-like repeat-containing protein, partial [Lachnospiraceae bacterium]|nr:GBS Bsp-like repeat-containing protein [Lachnospiraceae bacterium]
SSAWYSMRNYGCRMTAYSKLLRATGIENPGRFSPDSFFRWCRSNGWLAGTIREIGTPGNCAIAYAESKGRTLVREEAISMFKSSDPEERKQEIIDKINEGYYVILCSSAHFVYVDEVRTRLTQELWVDDSINGDNVYKVDRYVFQGSLADWENSDSRKNWHYRYFSVEEPDEVVEPPHVTDVRVHSVNREEGYYTLDATVSSDASQIDRVMFPTWTAKDDKDDLNPEWEYGTASEGYLVPALSDENESVYRFYVRMSDHNDENGKYFTYVYAYGRDGQRSAPGTITVPLRR